MHAFIQLYIHTFTHLGTEKAPFEHSYIHTHKCTNMDAHVHIHTHNVCANTRNHDSYPNSGNQEHLSAYPGTEHNTGIDAVH